VASSAVPTVVPDKYHVPQWLGGRAQRRFHVMVKPAGAACNLDCTYCFYLSKRELDGGLGSGRMSDDVLERFVRDYIGSVTGDEVVFSWQGGEPTLMGLDFFRRAVALQQQYARPAHRERPADQRHAARRGVGSVSQGAPLPGRTVDRRAA
jgi:uncharacterized protein